MRKLVAMVLAFLMLCTLLTGCEDVLSTPIIHGKEPVPNPAYAKIFTDHNLIDRPHRFSDLDSAAFVKVYDIGLIEKLEFGYRSYFIEEVKELVISPLPVWTKPSKRPLLLRLRECWRFIWNWTSAVTKLEQETAFTPCSCTLPI